MVLAPIRVMGVVQHALMDVQAVLVDVVQDVTIHVVEHVVLDVVLVVLMHVVERVVLDVVLVVLELVVVHVLVGVAITALVDAMDVVDVPLHAVVDVAADVHHVLGHVMLLVVLDAQHRAEEN